MRLGAIDAPESSHLCLDAASNRSHCDQKLAITLDDLIGGSVIIRGPTPQNTELRCERSSLRSRTQTSQVICRRTSKEHEDQEVCRASESGLLTDYKVAWQRSL